MAQYIKESDLSIRFEGDASYIRCLAHVLNLIVKDILQSLKSGDMKTASDVRCNGKWDSFSTRPCRPYTTQTYDCLDES